ncbi:MAG TPA: hypothetical protein ENN80_11170 [Candidatus Hydrogenedentes bacterium]|nr:hypothetical protein [Candidatus Hydrogenedentota bacterium]
MTDHGYIENGKVVLDDGLKPPEGAEVRLVVVTPDRSQEPAGLHESDALLAFAGAVRGLPADASRNIDHYLYGDPKQ